MQVSEKKVFFWGGGKKDKVKLIWLECCHIFKEIRNDYQHTASLLIH